MDESRVISQLEDLIKDRKSFIDAEREETGGDVFSEDKEALECIIAMYKNTKRELLHRDELLLQAYETSKKQDELIDKQNNELNILKQKVSEFEELDEQEQAEIIASVKQQTSNTIVPGIATAMRNMLCGKSKEDYAIIESNYYSLIRFLKESLKENSSVDGNSIKLFIKSIENIDIKVGGKENE